MIIFTQDSYQVQKKINQSADLQLEKFKNICQHEQLPHAKRLYGPLLDLIIQVVHTFFRMIILAQDSSTKMT